MAYQSFEELNVWKKARELRKRLRELLKQFPSEERYRLSDQIIRASRSITANIAEGHGRFHYQENIQFCRTLRGSLSEVLDHLTVALDEHYITAAQLDEYRNEIKEIERMLNGYIAYLKKRKNE
jgi:four helix bundle protein